MTVDGVWLFAFDDAAAGAAAGMAPCLLQFEDGHIRGRESALALVGHYRVNGTILTCFVRSPQPMGGVSRIFQFVGPIGPDAIQLQGSVVDELDAELGMHFGATLTRQAAAP